MDSAVQIAEDPAFAGLLSRCRAADERAWHELFVANLDFVHGVARQLGTPESELDDVCQEVFMVVFRRLETFKTGRLTTWIYRIVANVVSDRHRRRRFRAALQELLERMPGVSSAAFSAESAVARRDAQSAVSRVLERMSPKKREVFALYELECLSGEEIAERVGCKAETVWTRLHYARRQFAEIAQELGLGEERSGA